MIYLNLPGIYAFGHGIPRYEKTIFCDLSRAQIILWGHKCQKISEVFCKKFLTV